MTTKEIWRVVPSVDGLLASSEGRIMAIPFVAHGRHYTGTPWLGSWDGERYTVYFRGKNYKVARLICEAFNGPPPADKPVCMHLDENSRNNKPENLAWGTQQENLNAPRFLEYCKSRTGEQSPVVKARRRRAEVQQQSE